MGRTKRLGERSFGIFIWRYCCIKEFDTDHKKQLKNQKGNKISNFVNILQEFFIKALWIIPNIHTINCTYKCAACFIHKVKNYTLSVPNRLTTELHQVLIQHPRGEKLRKIGVNGLAIFMISSNKWDNIFTIKWSVSA